jgi:hypothetical protein
MKHLIRLSLLLICSISAQAEGTHKVHIMIGPNVRMLGLTGKDIIGPDMTTHLADDQWPGITLEPHFPWLPKQGGKEVKYAVSTAL